MRTYSLILILVVSFIPAEGPSCFGQPVVLQHYGDVNPIEEGWLRYDSFSASIETGPIDDAGTPAWFVDDNATGVGSVFYSAYLSADQTASAFARGWRLKLNLRTVDVPDASPWGSPFVEYRNGRFGYAIGFGTQPDGDPIVLLQNWGPLFLSQMHVVEGAGPGYHTYELVHHSGTDSAAVFVDGKFLSNYAGRLDTLFVGGPFLSWGAGLNQDTGQGNFNLVQFSIIPEPSTLAQFVLLSLLISASQRVRRR
jgi:hypothetical protein